MDNGCNCGGNKGATQYMTHNAATLADPNRLCADAMTNAVNIWQCHNFRQWRWLASTLTAANLALATDGGVPVATDVDTPLTVLGIGDPRVVRIAPNAPLDASQRYEFTASEAVTLLR